MYIRKTKDIYCIVGIWGIECYCDSMKEARENLKDYRENVNYPVWIEKHREKIENN